MIELFDRPEEIISMLQNAEPYVIKIKCIACSETQFMPFQPLIVCDNVVTIGCCSYPPHLIESVTVRYKTSFETSIFRTQETYKVKASYLQTLLSEQALRELREFGLLENNEKI